MRAMLSRLSILITSFCVCLLCFLYLLHSIENRVLLSPPARVMIDVHQGMAAKTIFEQLKTYPLGISYWQWFFIAHISGLDKHLQPGRYVIYGGERLGTVLLRFQQGRAELLSFHIFPGDTLRKIRERLNQLSTVTHDTRLFSDEMVARVVGLPEEKTVEGFLMPDTYFYSLGTSDLVLLRSSARAMQFFLHQAWLSRDASIPLKNEREALIMASLIEKEAALPDERATVASVFYNRLRRGMRLQTDPSVAYTMGHEGGIRKSDLRNTADPYNTYRRIGLPPSAICFPSKTSIVAALHPFHSAYLYFVAKGDGTTIFSKNLQQHIIAVNRYQRKDPHYVKKRGYLHHLRRH